MRTVLRLLAFSSREAMPETMRARLRPGASVFEVGNGNNRTICAVIGDMDTAHVHAGRMFRYMLIDPQIPDDVQAYLRTLNRWIITDDEGTK